MTNHDPLINQLAGHINREMHEREAITCPHRGNECLWEHPDTCRQCQGQNKVGVLGVNIAGITARKGGGK